ncbi:MAG: DUF2959 family protein [Verrucomicrobia bacterium]|nr:DUF2959 family protein [Verrucomicrobiota bacterium]
MKRKHRYIAVIQLTTAVLLCGCATAYYGAMEEVGVHKREILVDRVKDARDSQADAKEEFQDALEQFSEVVNFDGGNLKYKKLSSAFEDSEQSAREVHNRIDKIDSVAKALFLKHNLNSRAIASIENEANEIEKDVARLIKEMEASIAEADAFIREMGIE